MIEGDCTAGEMLREFRREAGASTREWGRALSMSHVMLSEVERGMRKFPHHWIRDEMFGGAGLLTPEQEMRLAVQLIADEERAAALALAQKLRGLRFAVAKLERAAEQEPVT